MKIRLPFYQKPYLLIITNLFCNFKCSYCIQQKSSLDVRYNNKKIDVPAVLEFLKRNPIAGSVKVMGGEATVHPDFELLMNGLLANYRKIVITTNLHGKWYRNFDITIEKMKAWGTKVQWNMSYHPSFMDVDLFIERVHKMRAAGLKIYQVSTTDTPELSPADAEKLLNAGIGWRSQAFIGRGKDGELLPRNWNDVNTKYPQLYDPSPYIDNYDEYVDECEDANFTENFYRPDWVNCTTSRFLIGPDNNVYPCHRHLYTEDLRYVCGSIYDIEMKKFRHQWNRYLNKWTLPCNTKCNPCDFKAVKIVSTGRANRLYEGDKNGILVKSAE